MKRALLTLLVVFSSITSWYSYETTIAYKKRITQLEKRIAQNEDSKQPGFWSSEGYWWRCEKTHIVFKERGVGNLSQHK